MHEEDGVHWAEVNGFRYSAAANDLPTLLRLIAESIDHLGDRIPEPLSPPDGGVQSSLHWDASRHWNDPPGVVRYTNDYRTMTLTVDWSLILGLGLGSPSVLEVEIHAP